MEIEIELYETASGHCPFDDWFESLRELHTRAKILTRLDRLKVGNFGDCKALSDAIAELRIHYGPGIRVYTPPDSKSPKWDQLREKKYGKK